MFSKLHERLGTAGFIISIIALVAALSGGAYAASGGLSGKQKKEVEKIAKKFAGKPGAAGAQGAQGATGPGGSTGPSGSTGKEGPAGKEGLEGVAGKTGFTEVLPSKKTETGTWGSFFETEGATTISFNIPLPADIANREILGEGETSPNCDNGTGAPGSAANPEAAPGYLCIFTTFFEHGGEVSEVLNPGTLSGPAGKTGSVLLLQSAAADFGVGTWAVTAP
jgi:hypothetical protein